MFINLLRGALPCLTTLVVSLLCACALPPPRAPLGTIVRPLSDTPQKTLILFLPGRGDRGDAFVKEGFLDEVRRRNIPADLMAVDLHYGYYQARTVVERLHDDVIAPARKRGYERIFIVGISAGGFGALRYAEEHPGDLTGIVLLSPFLGDGPVLDEIEHAGGLEKWQPGAIAPTDHERALWAFLKAYPGKSGDAEIMARKYPRLLLSFGHGDIFTRQCGLLRPLLPAEDTITGPGYHIWRTWKVLFAKVLDRKPF